MLPVAQAAFKGNCTPTFYICSQVTGWFLSEQRLWDNGGCVAPGDCL